MCILSVPGVFLSVSVLALKSIVWMYHCLFIHSLNGTKTHLKKGIWLLPSFGSSADKLAVNSCVQVFVWILTSNFSG